MHRPGGGPRPAAARRADHVPAATGRRQELRATLHEKLLPYLVRVGQALAKTDPEVGQRFEMPSRRLASAIYRTAARAMFDEAAAARERFVAAGLTEPFLSDLGETLDAYDKAVEDARLARIAHVGARAELEVVTEELMELVGLLDGLNRYRFRNNAELAAAWVSARNVVGAPRPAEPTPPAASSPPEEAVEPAA